MELLLGEFALKIFAVLGVLSAIVTILQFVFPNFREYITKFFYRVRKVKYENGWDTVKIDKLIENAENVTILQTWIPSLNRDISSWEKTSESCSFKILLLDKSLVKNRIECRGHDTDNIKDNIKRLKSFNKKNMELRQYKVLPFGPVYIIDDMIYWGLYLSNSCSMAGPMFSTYRNSELGILIENSVNCIWDKAISIE